MNPMYFPKRSLAFPSNGKRAVIVVRRYGVSLPIHVVDAHLDEVTFGLEADELNRMTNTIEEGFFEFYLPFVEDFCLRFVKRTVGTIIAAEHSRTTIPATIIR